MLVWLAGSNLAVSSSSEPWAVSSGSEPLQRVYHSYIFLCAFVSRQVPAVSHFWCFVDHILGPPVVPFYPLLVGRVPLLKSTTDERVPLF